jgi:hypothetical protein
MQIIRYFLSDKKNLNLSTNFIKNSQYIISRKIRPVIFKFHAGRQTDRPKEMATLAVVFWNCERI